MKKIYSKEDKSPGYSEEYIVYYSRISAEGFSIREEISYYAYGKNAHKAVRAKFKKDNPDSEVINIWYV